jgi:hypothetical protein
VLKSSESDRKSDALTVQRAFITSTKVLAMFLEYHLLPPCGYYLAHLLSLTGFCFPGQCINEAQEAVLFDRDHSIFPQYGDRTYSTIIYCHTIAMLSKTFACQSCCNVSNTGTQLYFIIHCSVRICFASYHSLTSFLLDLI